MKTTVVLNQKIAYSLVKLGHVILDKKPNRNDIKLMIYIFEETEQFIKDFKTIKEKNMKNRAI